MVVIRADRQNDELKLLLSGKAPLWGPRILKTGDGHSFYVFRTDAVFRQELDWRDHPAHLFSRYFTVNGARVLLGVFSAYVLLMVLGWLVFRWLRLRAEETILQRVWAPLQWSAHPVVLLRKCGRFERLLQASPFLCEFELGGKLEYVSARFDELERPEDPARSIEVKLVRLPANVQLVRILINFKFVRFWINVRLARLLGIRHFVVPVELMGSLDIENRKALPILRHVSAA